MVAKGPENVVIERTGPDTLEIRGRGVVEHNGMITLLDMARTVRRGDAEYELYEKRLPPE